MGFIHKGEIKYSNVEDKAEEKQLLNIGHMGETMCKYKNACKLHTFLEVCPLSKMKEGEEGISWHELFVLYKMWKKRHAQHTDVRSSKKNIFGKAI